MGLFVSFIEAQSSTSNAFNYYTINAATGARSFVGQSLSYSYNPLDNVTGFGDVSSGSPSEYGFFEIYDRTLGSYILSPGMSGPKKLAPDCELPAVAVSSRR